MRSGLTRGCGRLRRRGRRGREGDCRHPDRGGRNISVSADLEVDPGVRPGLGDPGQLLADRVGRRYRGDHRPHGRLRRLGRTAFTGSVHGVQGLRPDPVGTLGHRRDLQRSGCTAGPEAHARADRADVPRVGPEVERARDSQAEPRRQPAGFEDHAGLPVRRLGHVVQLHRLPVEDEPHLEEQGRHGHQRQPASSPAPTAASPTPTSPTRSRTSSSSHASRTRPGSSRCRGSGASTQPRRPSAR
jgi:hypothetical protein